MCMTHVNHSVQARIVFLIIDRRRHEGNGVNEVTAYVDLINGKAIDEVGVRIGSIISKMFILKTN